MAVFCAKLDELSANAMVFSSSLGKGSGAVQDFATQMQNDFTDRSGSDRVNPSPLSPIRNLTQAKGENAPRVLTRALNPGDISIAPSYYRAEWIG